MIEWNKDMAQAPREFYVLVPSAPDRRKTAKHDYGRTVIFWDGAWRTKPGAAPLDPQPARWRWRPSPFL